MDDGDGKSNDKNKMSVRRKECEKKQDWGLKIEGYQIEGISVAGHKTCIIVPSLNLAFDVEKCPQCAISQRFLFISNGHKDHICLLNAAVRMDDGDGKSNDKKTNKMSVRRKER